jgi:hypothetical protein
LFRYIAKLFGLANSQDGRAVDASASPADAMRDLRLQFLSGTASEVGIEPSEAFPVVFGVVMDLSISNGHTASVVALCDGNASLYTTGNFGVLGGIGHASVREAASDFVRVAQSHYAHGKPATDFPYPRTDHVHFYLLGYDGVRLLESEISALQQQNRSLLQLFASGQNVLTQLRLLTE